MLNRVGTPDPVKKIQKSNGLSRAGILRIIQSALLWILPYAVAAACGSDKHLPGLKPAKEVQVQREIGPKGGTLTLTEGPARGATLTIPAGALTHTVKVTMVSREVAVPLPPGVKAVGANVDLLPENLTFARPYTLTLPTTGFASGMYVLEREKNAWFPVPGATYDAERRVISAQLMRFYDPAPGKITLEKLEKTVKYGPTERTTDDSYTEVGSVAKYQILTGEPRWKRRVGDGIPDCTAVLIDGDYPGIELDYCPDGHCHAPDGTFFALTSASCLVGRGDQYDKAENDKKLDTDSSKYTQTRPYSMALSEEVLEGYGYENGQPTRPTQYKDFAASQGPPYIPNPLPDAVDNPGGVLVLDSIYPIVYTYIDPEFNGYSNLKAGGGDPTKFKDEEIKHDFALVVFSKSVPYAGGKRYFLNNVKRSGSVAVMPRKADYGQDNCSFRMAGYGYNVRTWTGICATADAASTARPNPDTGTGGGTGVINAYAAIQHDWSPCHTDRGAPLLIHDINDGPDPRFTVVGILHASGTCDDNRWKTPMKFVSVNYHADRILRWMKDAIVNKRYAVGFVPPEEKGWRKDLYNVGAPCSAALVNQERCGFELTWQNEVKHLRDRTAIRAASNATDLWSCSAAHPENFGKSQLCGWELGGNPNSVYVCQEHPYGGVDPGYQPKYQGDICYACADKYATLFKAVAQEHDCIDRSGWSPEDEDKVYKEARVRCVKSADDVYYQWQKIESCGPPPDYPDPSKAKCYTCLGTDKDQGQFTQDTTTCSYKKAIAHDCWDDTGWSPAR